MFVASYAEICPKNWSTRVQKKLYPKLASPVRKLHARRIISDWKNNQTGIFTITVWISSRKFWMREHVVDWWEASVKCWAAIYSMEHNCSLPVCWNLRSWPERFNCKKIKWIIRTRSPLDWLEWSQWANRNRCKSSIWFYVVQWMVYIWKRLVGINLIQMLL